MKFNHYYACTRVCEIEIQSVHVVNTKKESKIFRFVSLRAPNTIEENDT